MVLRQAKVNSEIADVSFDHLSEAIFPCASR